MRKKYVWIITIFIVLFQILWFPFVNAQESDNPKKQPEVCNWPSEMMSLYFQFQKEAKSILLWSKVNERRFSVSMWDYWLFRNEILNLHATTAIDLLATSELANARSAVSTASTSVVLLLLASLSVLQSNTEWFAILFSDRPIVRDYKEMLDIETELFNVAFFRSKQVNLIRPFLSDWMADSLSELVKKYQDLWLLDASNEIRKNAVIDDDITLANVLIDLISMNTAMKHFIMLWWDVWKRALADFNWCLGMNSASCDSRVSILRFNRDAIDKLYEDYKWARSFWWCNLNATNFKSTISKGIKNNAKSVKVAFQDVKDAMKRLKSALLGTSAEDDWKKKKDKCDLSYYEMAQLRAYWWSDWSCWDVVSVSTDLGGVDDFFRNKKSQKNNKKKTTGAIDKANQSQNSGAVAEGLNSINVYNEKMVYWNQNFWSGSVFNKSFSPELLSDISSSFGDVFSDYNQSQENAMAWDLSSELIKIRWLLDQLDAVMKAAEKLQKILQEIVDYQCAG